MKRSGLSASASGTRKRETPQVEKHRWLRRLTTFGLSLVLLMGLSTLGSRVHWAFELFVHFRFQYLIAAVALGLVAGALRMWPQLALAAAIGVWNGLYVMPLFVGGAAVDGGPRPVRIVHANVLSSNEDYQALQGFVYEQQPDLVLLQEVTEPWIEAVREIDGYSLALSSPRIDNFGLAILHRDGDSEGDQDGGQDEDSDGQRLRIELGDPWIEEVELGTTTLPMAVQPLTVDDKKVAILSVHTLPPAGGRMARNRNEQLQWVADWAVRTRETGVRPVVVGDLNITPFSPHFRRLLRSGELENSQRGFGYHATWGAWPVRIPIDHALVDADLVVVHREVGPRIGSDHRPLIVDLGARRSNPAPGTPASAAVSDSRSP